MSRTPEEQAIAAALAQAERDVACGINPSSEPLRVALHKAVDVIASVSAERDAARAERHDIPHHIRLALAAAQRAFDDRDLRVFGTFNEDLQPVVDAASAWITALSRDLSDARAEARTARAEVAALRARLVEGMEQAERERADVVAWLRARADHEAQDAAHAQNAEDYQSAMWGREVCRLAVSAFEAGEHEGAASPK